MRLVTPCMILSIVYRHFAKGLGIRTHAGLCSPTVSVGTCIWAAAQRPLGSLGDFS